MSRATMFLSCLAMFVFALGLTGCPSGGDTSQPATGGGDAHAGHDYGEGADHAHDEDADHEQGEDADHEHAEETSGSGEMPEGLAELSDEDRALAVKQKTCPVSGELLGSMGAPIKVTVKDREVFLCCAGCKGAITEDPDKYLAKLDE
ncbi:MAG: hypothetical protein HQ582_06370 [Planctomycetes bacterium]|nr:hypothetical protein [Planctomycetota bacterium]